MKLNRVSTRLRQIEEVRWNVFQDGDGLPGLYWFEFLAATWEIIRHSGPPPK